MLWSLKIRTTGGEGSDEDRAKRNGHDGARQGYQPKSLNDNMIDGTVCLEDRQDAVWSWSSVVQYKPDMGEATDDSWQVLIRMMIFHSPISNEMNATRLADVAAYREARAAYTVGSLRSRKEVHGPSGIGQDVEGLKDRERYTNIGRTAGRRRGGHLLWLERIKWHLKR